jgi:hypothetical protein
MPEISWHLRQKNIRPFQKAGGILPHSVIIRMSISDHTSRISPAPCPPLKDDLNTNRLKESQGAFKSVNRRVLD